MTESWRARRWGEMTRSKPRRKKNVERMRQGEECCCMIEDGAAWQFQRQDWSRECDWGNE